jgi:hypothetical protein
MDTRFWGPDGWLLLHSITEKYPNNPSEHIKDIYYNFFHSIEHILPCVYCRNSFAQYMIDLPIDDYLKNKKQLCLWMYKIHNKVNDKLKSQGLHSIPNPTFKIIYERYKQYVIKVQSDNQVPGFDFLYSIIFNHASNLDKLPKHRIDQLIIFLNLLPIILPFNLLKKLYLEYIIHNPIEKYRGSAKSLKVWIFELQIKYNQKINKTAICFHKTCTYIDKFKTGCSNKTCRLFK